MLNVIHSKMTPPLDLPAHLDPLYSNEQIDAKLSELAATLDSWAIEAEAQTGRLMLAVCILRGGVFFFSDVLLRMNRHVEPGFCRAWSYAKTANEKPEDNIEIDWQKLSVAGRDVVLFDNICDSGRTLATAQTWALANGAHRVRSVVMAFRERADSQHTPTFSGFSYPGREWLVGYGLRDREAQMMNTRIICTVRASGG